MGYSTCSAIVHDLKALKISEDRNNTILKKGSKRSNTSHLLNDNIYTLYRKDALEMASLASQYFEAASKAYRKKDYLSAKQHSMMAKEKKRIAEELNSQAAAKILKAINSKNNIWRLDLHCLHKFEAIEALQDQLNKIESGQILPKQLEVITGVGKHSKGEPVIPNSIKSFLNENKYDFEEIRPGALKVWPKYYEATMHAPHQVACK